MSDWKKITASKDALRKKLAKMPIEEKLRILDALRERTVQQRKSAGKPPVQP